MSAAVAAAASAAAARHQRQAGNRAGTSTSTASKHSKQHNKEGDVEMTPFIITGLMAIATPLMLMRENRKMRSIVRLEEAQGRKNWYLQKTEVR